MAAEEIKAMDFESEEEFYNAMYYKLWLEWVNETDKMTPEDQAELKQFVDYFMKRTGAKEGSLAVRLYMAFIGGVDKGVDAVDKIEMGVKNEQEH